ncbi:pathogenicity island protein [Staphylococcus sp. HMSC73A05]|uniref:type II toxin-antitoxin system antitoxin TscA n=1 Tax=Staphylococcus sp. HMSC73A05 TaxID=1608900 RepID=UPI0008A8A9F3|nr:pathogenicity island protein [Staphylococcus sp. HMSC73A05]OHS62333.1 pathogenicity island protein [Staphylococcus sp. HMSC73A05]
MNNEQKEVIEHLVYQLELSVMNNLESYEHTEYVNGIEVVSEISREKHLELIMKWCTQELKNNFQLEKGE